MKIKNINNAKLIITVRSDKGSNEIKAINVFDNRKNRNWTNEEITERGIEFFLDLQHLKEALNWNLNGDSSKYKFKWGQSGKYDSEGRAYVFD